jgi:hypothetical protein
MKHDLHSAHDTVEQNKLSIIREDSIMLFAGAKIVAKDPNSEMYVTNWSLNFKKGGEWGGISFGSEDVRHSRSIENASIERIDLDGKGSYEVIIRCAYGANGSEIFSNFKGISILSIDSFSELFASTYYADQYTSGGTQPNILMKPGDEREPLYETAWIDISIHPGWISVGKTEYKVSDPKNERAAGLENMGLSALRRGKYILEDGRFVWVSH